MITAAHDQYVEFHPAPPPSNRSFGLTVGAILVGIGLVRTYLDHTGVGTTVLLASGGTLFLLGLIAPNILAVANRGWMALGGILAAVVNPILMLLIFAIIFVPIAVVFRLKGRDALALAPDKDAPTYWREGSGAQSDARLKDQF
jgi:hypothetical protein